MGVAHVSDRDPAHVNLVVFCRHHPTRIDGMGVVDTPTCGVEFDELDAHRERDVAIGGGGGDGREINHDETEGIG